MSKIESAVQFSLGIARDDSHGYSQDVRWGPDYDCSSLMIEAYQQAGVPVKDMGATYTGNMKSVFCQCGFQDVTHLCNLATGRGTKRGDVLLNEAHHTAMVVEDNGGLIVHASINERGGAHGGQTGDQTGKEICTRSYYNKPWDCVLRYMGDDSDVEENVKDYTATGIVKHVSDGFLNVRAGAGVSREKIGEFKEGDIVYINGVCTNGWYRCTIWDGRQGFVSGNYVEIQSESTIDEYKDPNNIVWELKNRGIISDSDGMLAAIQADPNGKLYWLAHNIVHYLRTHE